MCYDYKMLGIYIQHVDFDDYDGACDCKDDNDQNTFPASYAAAAGANGIPLDTLTSCRTFAYV